MWRPGSPLSPEGFEWVHDSLGSDTWLFSTSGGTDVCTPFVGGVPTLPVYRGELQARCLGIDVQAWDPDGRPLTDEVGELVVCQPMPSMPLFLWGDEDGSRMRESYYDMYPDSLVDRIRRRIRADCSPRHVPDEVRQIDAVPRTLSGKVLEVPVKRILTGTPVARAVSRESLANPDALDYFVELGADQSEG